jgi:Peptidase family M1 domain
VTKVLGKAQGFGLTTAFVAAVSVLSLFAQTPPAKPAEALYLQLGTVGLDPTRVYQVRGASIERSAVHITLEDGTIAFTQDVMGRITGAFFEGDGEVLVTPPNDVERRSMSSFTGMAILEEHFATAYFRFNDDLPIELQPDLRPMAKKQEFVDHWSETARNLANADAMRLLISFSRMLPARNSPPPPPSTAAADERFFHARLQGTKLGIFDVHCDSRSTEQIDVGQSRTADNGVTYYDVWTSFAPTSPSAATEAKPGSPERDRVREDWITLRRYSIAAEVQPPKRIHATARMQVETRQAGSRVLLFELSRFLQVESVQSDGQDVEFIHNPAVDGTQLSRRGNDVVAVILPVPTQIGQKIDLVFTYGGEVLAEAGSGLLYVGARGTWYPNRGFAMADFDLQFTYPQGWTLVATGKPTPPAAPAGIAKAGQQTSRWVSERPIPLAGFNLGKYKVSRAQAGNVSVETYATGSVERDFPGARLQPLEPADSSHPDPSHAEASPRSQQMIIQHRPSPVENAGSVGESAAQAIQFYSERFGPYPYSRLALTQLPGRESQGWPGLVFLSSYAFLDDEERAQLHLEPYRILIQHLIPAHETAHQWWGDLVAWNSYRDQWFSEGLANYCALMMLQEKNPSGFREIMERYRRDLVTKNRDGVAPMDAGPVTLGGRLLSSRFPEGYEAISYGRGTWLFHMLRTMLNDAALKSAPGQSPGRGSSSLNEPFVRALLRLRQKYEGKSITTRELLDVFTEDLPSSLRYEGKNSLEWFLQGWINGTALPRLELKGVKFTPKGAGVAVTGAILQKDAPPDLVTSVPVYAVTEGKQLALLGRVFADGEESTFHIAAPPGTHKILLDPYETVLTSPK